MPNPLYTYYVSFVNAYFVDNIFKQLNGYTYYFQVNSLLVILFLNESELIY